MDYLKIIAAAALFIISLFDKRKDKINLNIAIRICLLLYIIQYIILIAKS